MRNTDTALAAIFAWRGEAMPLPHGTKYILVTLRTVSRDRSHGARGQDKQEEGAALPLSSLRTASTPSTTSDICSGVATNIQPASKRKAADELNGEPNGHDAKRQKTVSPQPDGVLHQRYHLRHRNEASRTFLP